MKLEDTPFLYVWVYAVWLELTLILFPIYLFVATIHTVVLWAVHRRTSPMRPALVTGVGTFLCAWFLTAAGVMLIKMYPAHSEDNLLTGVVLFGGTCGLAVFTTTKLYLGYIRRHSG